MEGITIGQISQAIVLIAGIISGISVIGKVFISPIKKTNDAIHSEIKDMKNSLSSSFESINSRIDKLQTEVNEIRQDCNKLNESNDRITEVNKVMARVIYAQLRSGNQDALKEYIEMMDNLFIEGIGLGQKK
jgi:methyl-accepting chemotaxis protein